MTRGDWQCPVCASTILANVLNCRTCLEREPPAPPQSIDLSFTPENLLRTAWALAGRKGEPKGPEKKKLQRQVHRLLTRGTPSPVDGRTTTRISYEKGMRFVETILHNAGRDLSDLKTVPPDRRYDRLAKPWKGRAGRAAVKQSGTTSKRMLAKVHEAKRLQGQGLQTTEIIKVMKRGGFIEADTGEASARRNLQRWLGGK